MQYTDIGDKLATALGVTDGAEFQFTDRFGVTYGGDKQSHTVLAAIMRDDVSPNLGFDEAITDHLRQVAALVAQWFTCEQADPDHMAAFAGLSARSTCEVVALAGCIGNSIESLKKVGATTVSEYTEFLLSDSVNIDGYPRVVDEPLKRLSRARLDITESTAEDVDAVTVWVRVRASTVLSWNVKLDVQVPVGEVNNVMLHTEDLEDFPFIADAIQGDPRLALDEADQDDYETEITVSKTAGTIDTTLQRLHELAVGRGMDKNDFDGVVHDVFSRRASSVNDSGLERQIEFLLGELSEHEVADLIGTHEATNKPGA